MSDEQNPVTPPSPPPDTDIREGAAEWVAIGVGAANLALNAYNRNDDLHWPRRDGLNWPRFASVVVGVDVA